MPNWCDNTLFIYGKDDDITWIEDHFNDYVGRRCDDAFLRKDFAFIQGNTVFSSLYIGVRTAGSGVYQFLQLILYKYKNIHIKWHYYIELGCGAGDVELGKDKKGNFYEFFTEIDQDPYKGWEEYEYELFQEFPQKGEFEWDKERLQQPHWYEEDQNDVPTEKELWYDDLRINGTYEDWCEYMDSK